jgi:hypothetical protein
MHLKQSTKSWRTTVDGLMVEMKRDQREKNIVSLPHFYGFAQHHDFSGPAIAYLWLKPPKKIMPCAIVGYRSST